MNFLVGLAMSLIANFAFAHENHGMVAHLAFESGVHAHAFWEVAPGEADEAILRLELRRASDHALYTESVNLLVDAHMPDMDHAAIPAQVELVAPGVWRAQGLYFFMSGYWEVRVRLEEQTLTIPVEIGGEYGHSHGESHSHAH